MQWSSSCLNWPNGAELAVGVGSVHVSMCVHTFECAAAYVHAEAAARVCVYFGISSVRVSSTGCNSLWLRAEAPGRGSRGSGRSRRGSKAARRGFAAGGCGPDSVPQSRGNQEKRLTGRPSGVENGTMSSCLIVGSHLRSVLRRTICTPVDLYGGCHFPRDEWQPECFCSRCRPRQVLTRTPSLAL